VGVDPRPGDIAQARALAAKKKRERESVSPVRGENAAEKARTPVVQAAREVVDSVVAGAPAASSAERLRRLALSHSEKRDVESYSRARSTQAQDAAFGKLKRDTAAFALDYGTAPVNAYLLGHPNLRTGLRQTKDWVGSVPEILQNPGTSKREKLEAVGDAALVGGGLNFLPGRGRSPKSADKAADKATPAGAERVMEALPKVQRLRREQDKLASAERGKRAAAAERALREGGDEGYALALSELKGELPKLKHGALEDFDEAAATKLFKSIREHADLRTFEKISTETALRKLLEGKVITRSENVLLARAFGDDLATKIVESMPFWRKAADAGVNVINVPRAIMASYDVSAPFRQGLVLGARHPVMGASELRPMFKALRSKGAYDDIMDEIASRSSFPTMQKSGLQLTDLQGLSTREEAFITNYAERIPLVGIGVRGSSRAYTAFLNKFRADAFDNYLRMADEQGLDIDDPYLLKSIANWVNTASGRGTIKSLEGAMPALTTVLFSPRLMWSRLQLLNPAYYAQLHPFARKQALRGMGQLLGAVSMTLWMAKMAGAEVGLDPRNTDFGKIKVNNTRVDISGGLQSYLVNAYRLVKGETVSSTTGEVRKLEGGFGKPSRWSIFGDFLENKTAPVFGHGIDWAKNENFQGDPFDPVRDTGKLFVPLGAQNAYEGYKEGGVVPAAMSAGLGGIGFGVQTYEWKPPKGVKKAYDEALKDIDAGVRAGELTKEDAKILRAAARSDYETAVRRRLLDGKNLSEAELERQLVIDDSIREGDSLQDINSFLQASGFPPATAAEVDATERELLRLDVQVGK
jgi:hypothetical protein